MAKDLISSIIIQDKFTETIIKAENGMKKLEKTFKSAEKGMSLNPKINISGIKDGVSKGIKALEPLKKAVSNIWSVGSKAVMWGGGLAGVGIGYALNKSGEMEQLGMAMSTILKSDKEGAKMMADMKRYAIKTPFEMMDLANTVKFALATGFDKNDLLGEKGIITDVGNTTSALGGGGDKLTNIMNQLSQMKMKGKAQAEELRILAENGINAWGYLSKATGKTTAELFKMSEKGLIPADKAIESIRKGMRKDFAGMMIKQSSTLLGLWSSMKDVFNVSIMTKFGDGISSKVKPALMGLVDELTGTEDSFASFESKMFSAGEKVGDFIVNTYNKAREFFKLWDDPEFQKLSTGEKIIFVINQGLDSLNAWMNGDGKEQVKEFVESFTSITIGVLKTAAPQFLELGNSLGTEIIKGMGEGVITNIIPGAKELKKYFPEGNASFNKPITLGIPFTKPSINPITNFGAKKAIGMPYVPRDNYPAMLHRGESVVPARDNKGSGSNVVTVNMYNTVTASNKDDVDSFIKLIEDRLIEVSNNMGYAH